MRSPLFAYLSWSALPLLGWAVVTQTLIAAELSVTVRFDRAPPPAVLVWVPNLTPWQPTGAIVVDQRDQTFVPALVVAPPGGTVRIHNTDAMPHNVFSLTPETDLGIGEPESVLERNVTWPVGEVVAHGCKIHPQMRLWIACLDTSNHQVLTFPAGALSVSGAMQDVLATATELRCWSPRGEPLSVTLPTRGTLAETAIQRQGRTIGSLIVGWK